MSDDQDKLIAEAKHRAGNVVLAPVNYRRIVIDWSSGKVAPLIPIDDDVVPFIPRSAFVRRHPAG
jgi:hypothetical protein